MAQGIGERTIYGHTGWRIINGQHVFLSPNGVAIGRDGAVPEVSVDLSEVTQGGHMGRYGLPEKWAIAAEDIRLSLATLDLAADPISFPVMGVVVGAPLMPFNPLNFVVGLSGPTGKGKTAFTTLVLSHFAYPKGFNYMSAPAGFQSTFTVLERYAYLL